MIWNSFGDFVHMGGYGLYVWGAYGMTLALMGLDAWVAVRRRQRAVAHARSGVGA